MTLSVKAAVVYHTESLPIAGNLLFLDLDQDSTSDIKIDVSAVESGIGDPYYIASPLGTALLAESEAITTSFTAGEVVSLGSLSFVGSSGSLLTGGVYLNALGNYVSEGWGGGVPDDFGNIFFPDGGPTHWIDLFLVKLDRGVAWVDLESRGFGGGDIKAHWGYLEDAGDTFTVIGVPEVSVTWLCGVGISALFCRRRR